MLTFTEYLKESASVEKNTHLEHLEEEILKHGSKGISFIFDTLLALRDMLSGHSDSRMNLTVKWDGAPAIFAGHDPETGNFFVGTKSIFNVKPKINFTHEDIDKNHSGGLSEKLHVALDNLKELGIPKSKVLQGDMMFTKNDLSSKKIHGESYLTFQPNTIVYAVPESSDLAKKIRKANIGIVFHTEYTGGSTVKDMRASFGANINGLKKTDKIWYQDADFEDVSGNVLFTEDELKEYNTLLSEMGKAARKIDAKLLNQLTSGEINKLLKIYNNSRIRAGTGILIPSNHVSGFIGFIQERKGPKAAELVEFVKKNKTGLMNIFYFMIMAADAKLMVIRKLEKAKSMPSFVETSNGYKVSSPEGFVAVDRLGKAVKLVDRLEFSRRNFNAVKKWVQGK